MPTANYGLSLSRYRRFDDTLQTELDTIPEHDGDNFLSNWLTDYKNSFLDTIRSAPDDIKNFLNDIQVLVRFGPEFLSALRDEYNRQLELIRNADCVSDDAYATQRENANEAGAKIGRVLVEKAISLIFDGFEYLAIRRLKLFTTKKQWDSFQNNIDPARNFVEVIISRALDAAGLYDWLGETFIGQWSYEHIVALERAVDELTGQQPPKEVYGENGNALEAGNSDFCKSTGSFHALDIFPTQERFGSFFILSAKRVVIDNAARGLTFIVHFDAYGNQTSSFPLPTMNNNTEHSSYNGISRSSDGFHVYYEVNEFSQRLTRFNADGTSYRISDFRTYLNIAKLDINGYFVSAKTVGQSWNSYDRNMPASPIAITFSNSIENGVFCYYQLIRLLTESGSLYSVRQFFARSIDLKTLSVGDIIGQHEELESLPLTENLLTQCQNFPYYKGYYSLSDPSLGKNSFPYGNATRPNYSPAFFLADGTQVYILTRSTPTSKCAFTLPKTSTNHSETTNLLITNADDPYFSTNTGSINIPAGQSTMGVILADAQQHIINVPKTDNSVLVINGFGDQDRLTGELFSGQTPFSLRPVSYDDYFPEDFLSGRAHASFTGIARRSLSANITTFSNTSYPVMYFSNNQTIVLAGTSAPVFLEALNNNQVISNGSSENATTTTTVTSTMTTTSSTAAALTTTPNNSNTTNSTNAPGASPESSSGIDKNLIIIPVAAVGGTLFASLIFMAVRRCLRSKRIHLAPNVENNQGNFQLQQQRMQISMMFIMLLPALLLGFVDAAYAELGSKNIDDEHFCKSNNSSDCNIIKVKDSTAVNHDVRSSISVNHASNKNKEMSLASNVTSSMINGAFFTAIPEAIGDTLYLSGAMSKQASQTTKATINLLMMLMLGSWAAMLFGQATKYSLKAIGYSEALSSSAGNAVNLFCNIANNLTPTGFISTVANYFGGRLGFWAEKAVVQQFCSETDYTQCEIN